MEGRVARRVRVSSWTGFWCLTVAWEEIESYFGSVWFSRDGVGVFDVVRWGGVGRGVEELEDTYGLAMEIWGLGFDLSMR